MKGKYLKYIMIAIISILMLGFSGCASSKAQASRSGANHPKNVKDKPSVSAQKKTRPAEKDYRIKKYKSPSMHKGRRR